MEYFNYRDGLDIINRQRLKKQRELAAEEYLDYLEEQREYRIEEIHNLIFSLGMGIALGLLFAVAVFH